MTEPGTLDGGDVLQLGKTLYVGMTDRTNEAGIKQLAAFVSSNGYRITTIPVKGCLHLKSAVSLACEETLLVNRSWVDTKPFDTMEFIDIDPAESFAANALLVGGELVYPANYPKTLQRLEEKGIPVRAVDVSELQKAEGGVTCCSLIFEKDYLI